MSTVFVIAGQTATGKSEAALTLCERISGEIVSADAIQVYRGMDIGTAKLPVAARRGIPHHLLDIVDPDFNYSVALYQAAAFTAIDDILARGRVPVVVGGTGLYISSITNELDFSAPQDKAVRTELNALLEKHGAQYMHDMLRALSEEEATRVHVNNVKRVLRRIEVLQNAANESGYDLKRESCRYEFRIHGLTMPRDVLYERINARVDKMFAAGLENEVRSLAERFGTDGIAFQAIGYKEVLKYLSGGTDLETAAEAVKRNTRRYAKRQQSWFSRERRIVWHDVQNYPCADALVDVIIKS